MTALTLAALGFGMLLISAGWADRSVMETLNSVLKGEDLPPTAPLFDVTPDSGTTEPQTLTPVGEAPRPGGVPSSGAGAGMEG